MENNNMPMGNMSQAKTFVLGILAGILVLCTIGFFIMLGIFLKGGNTAKADTTDTLAADTTTQPADTGAQPAPANVPAVDEKNDHIRGGGADAKATLIVYSDFECPYCGRYEPTLKQALAEYGNDIRIVYRHFPLSFHPNAQPAAEAAECASEQGKFWEFHDALFANQDQLGSDFYEATAGELGLNISKFDDCVSTHKYKTKIQQQMNAGSAAGVGGTPNTFVMGANGSTTVSGAQPYENLKAAIESVM